MVDNRRGIYSRTFSCRFARESVAFADDGVAGEGSGADHTSYDHFSCVCFFCFDIEWVGSFS